MWALKWRKRDTPYRRLTLYMRFLLKTRSSEMEPDKPKETHKHDFISLPLNAKKQGGCVKISKIRKTKQKKKTTLSFSSKLVFN